MFKFASKIAAPMQNSFMIVAIFFIAYNLIGRLCLLFNITNSSIKNIGSVMQQPMLICAFSAAIIYCILRKGVFINTSEIVIAKYTFVPFNFKMRIHIPYNEIEKINVNYSNIHFTKYRFSFVTLCGDETYNVELTLKSGKKYFFSIENQEEFYQNVNIMIDKAKNMKNSTSESNTDEQFYCTG